MPAELVEVATVLDHAVEKVWEVVGDPAAYPLFVREVPACRLAGSTQPGRGASYEVTFAVGGRSPAHEPVDVLVHRPEEHLVLVTPHRDGGHLSIRLVSAGPRRTDVQVVIAMPRALPAELTPSPAWLRKRVKRALGLIDSHLAGRSVSSSKTGLDQASAPLSKLSVARTLAKAGVLAPARPDRLVRQASALNKWGSTLVGGYRAGAVRSPGDVAIIDERGELTYAEVDTRTTRLANGLVAHGARAGQPVALMCRNHASLVEAAVACGKLGVDVLLLNTGLSADQVRATITAHRPAVLLADDEFSPLLHELPESLPWISTWNAEPGGVTADTLIDGSDPDQLPPPKAPGRLIVLTSGTTGAPRGARRRNPPGLSTAASILSRMPLQAGERALVCAPLFHTWGLAAMQLTTALRGCMVLQRRFDAEATLRAVHELRCTSLFVVPIMLQRILDLPERVRGRYDTSSLRVVASSGSALAGSLVTRFMDCYGEILYNLYGSTEVSWASIADPTDLRAAPTTAGHCPAGTRVGILDERGTPVPPGVVGRICVGNEMLFEGYTNGTRTEVHDKLMVTGDLGYLDAAGRLFVSGRDDDMIVSGGENVFPRPVEDLLLTMPQVRDVAVVGVPDREYGQRFAAFVSLKPGRRLDADAVRNYVHDHLSRFAVPRDVIFVRVLPRNATGKIMRRLLVTEA